MRQEVLLISAVICFGLVIQRLLIPFAHATGMVAKPSRRCRHQKVTPLLGGLGIYLTWMFGLAGYCFLNPSWGSENFTSLLLLTSGATILLLTGLIDDKLGLSFRFRLFVQFSATLFLFLEPNVYSFLIGWQNVFGVLIWPLAAICIVGIINGMNLVDGVDGLSGSSSLAVTLGIVLTGVLSAQSFGLAYMGATFLAISLSTFLVFNTNPSRVFMGDNGSLVLGFLLSAFALMSRPYELSWVVPATILIMFIHPVLDMGSAIFKRIQYKQSLFSGDRCHLHHRLMRRGYSVRATVAILVALVSLKQLFVVATIYSNPWWQLALCSLSVLSIGSFYFWLQSSEQQTVEQLAANYRQTMSEQAAVAWQGSTPTSSFEIDLQPIFEMESLNQAGDTAVFDLVNAIKLKAEFALAAEEVKLEQAAIMIRSDRDAESVEQEVFEQIQEFLDENNVDIPSSSLPIKII